MLPFAGAITARVLRVAPVSIHGDVYFDLLVEPEADPAGAGGAPLPPVPEGQILTLALRAPMHSTPDRQAPEVGRRVRVQFLMQQVTGITYI